MLLIWLNFIKWEFIYCMWLTNLIFYGSDWPWSTCGVWAEQNRTDENIIWKVEPQNWLLNIFNTIKKLKCFPNLAKIVKLLIHLKFDIYCVRQEFDAAQRVIQALPPARGNYDLFMEHVNEWRKTWARGRIEVQGADNQLTKTVRFAQFYILSSLPAESPSLPPVFTEPFFGCGRTSIGKGSLKKDYQGHVMWDNEFYIMPAILPFHPGMAKNQIRYR